MATIYATCDEALAHASAHRMGTFQGLAFLGPLDWQGRPLWSKHTPAIARCARSGCEFGIIANGDGTAMADGGDPSECQGTPV